MKDNGASEPSRTISRDGVMLKRNEGNEGEEDIDALELMRRALQLGIDVGEHGHIEGVGWVNVELRSIMAKAERIGIVDEVREKYKEGKQKGAAKRSRFLGGQGTAGASVPRGPSMPRPPELEPSRRTINRPRGFVERIPAEEGLRSTINVMTFTARNPEMKKDVNGLLASVFDLQENLMDIEDEESQRDTFGKCADLLTGMGWVSDCSLAYLGSQRAVVILKSNIAGAFGQSDEPVCQPICNLLETVGRKLFGRSVLVTEIECASQGKPACRFEIHIR